MVDTSPYYHKIDKSKLFLGEINGMSFSMKHKSDMNTIGTEIMGLVKAEGNGSIVEIKFSLPDGVKVMLLLMYSFLFLFFLITLILFFYALFHGRLNFWFLIGPLGFILMQIMIYGLMENEIT